VDGTRICPTFERLQAPAPSPLATAAATCAAGAATYPESGTYTGWAVEPVSQPHVFDVVVTQHAGPDRPFTSTPAPSLYGWPSIGNLLTVKVSGWAPQPDHYTYEWFRDGQSIAGIPSDYSAWTPRTSDLGSRISVCVTGHRDGFVDSRRCSAPTEKLKTGSFTVVPIPTMAGTRKTGSTLAAVTGDWGEDVTFTYQWQRNEYDIRGATGPTFKVRARDVGAHLRVLVTGHRAHYTSRLAISRPIKISKGNLGTTTPTIDGVPAVGAQITANAGVWAPSSVKLSYQWYRNGKKIHAATHRRYTVTAKDRGKRLTVKATGRKSGYLTAHLTSAPVTIS
jgi:hypothetical protein